MISNWKDPGSNLDLVIWIFYLFFCKFLRLFLIFYIFFRVLVCERACVRHTRACGNLGAKEVRSFMDLCVRMCVRAGFFGCVTRVRSHLKFFNKIIKKRLKTKGFLRRSGSLTFTAEEFYKNNRNNALVFKWIVCLFLLGVRIFALSTPFHL